MNGLLNSRLLNLRIIEFEEHWIQGSLNSWSLNPRIIEVNIVESKVNWIQWLLNPRVIESEVEIFERNVVESKVVECLLHSTQRSSVQVYGPDGTGGTTELWRWHPSAGVWHRHHGTMAWHPVQVYGPDGTGSRELWQALEPRSYWHPEMGLLEQPPNKVHYICLHPLLSCHK